MDGVHDLTAPPNTYAAATPLLCQFFILPQRKDSIDSQLLKLHRIRNSELIQYLLFYGFLAEELGLANFNGAPK